MKKKMPANLRKLLEWLDGVSPLLETKIVAAGLSHTLDKALMQSGQDWCDDDRHRSLDLTS